MARIASVNAALVSCANRSAGIRQQSFSGLIPYIFVALLVALAGTGYGLYHEIGKNGELSTTIEQRDKTIADQNTAREKLDALLIKRDRTIRANEGKANEMQQVIQSLRSDAAISKCLDLPLPADWLERLRRAAAGDESKTIGSDNPGLPEARSQRENVGRTP